MESIIFKYLCEQPGIAKVLTSYMQTPAVFNTKAPDDKDDGWDGEAQFPRIIFDLDMQADPERKVSGQLYIDVMCQNAAYSATVEEIEAMVREAVDGCFFSSDELTISAQWNASNPFEQGDDKVEGTTIVYDVLAYPNQITTSPDPIAGTNLWVKVLYPDAFVIGKDKNVPTWKPTDESPAIYCSLFRLGESPRLKSTANVDWFGAEIRVNVMAPSENVRATICRTLAQVLTHATRIMLDDGSPMLIDRINVNMAADPMRAGQIQINATYGVLPVRTPQTKIRRTAVSGMGAETEV